MFIPNVIFAASEFLFQHCLYRPWRWAASTMKKRKSGIAKIQFLKHVSYKRFLLCFFLTTMLSAQTIEQKKAAAVEKENKSEEEMQDILEKVNERLVSLREQLKGFYAQAQELQKKGESEGEYKKILQKVNRVKKDISELEMEWRQTAVDEAKKDDEGYALWDQEDTTLTQLIMEYGALDYLYIVPPEMASFKLNMHSNIPIPRESWGEVLEIILSHNGIGVKELNPYARQLFILKQDLAAVKNVATCPGDLEMIPNGSRLFYLFSPLPEQAKNVFQFFERFADVKQTFVYQVSGKIAIVSSKEEVEKLLSLYHMVWEDKGGKVTRVVPVSKLSSKEMERVLSTFFGESNENKARPPFAKTPGDHEGLVVFSLSQGNAIVLIGQQAVVDRAEKLVKETEEQLLDPTENAIFIYACRHSDPVELAETLDKVYLSLLAMPSEDPRDNIEVTYQAQGIKGKVPDGYEPSPPLVIAPKPLDSGIRTKLEVEQKIERFIPDPKTGNLMMVVRRDTYPRIREILRRLDVPKKMVQIEVLLFERKLRNQNNFGMNLLRLGNDKNGVKYEGLFAPSGKGVFQFFFSGDKSKNFPAFDIAYSFLMTLEDVQLNSAPSITVTNQVPATIAIQEEISINNGAAPVDTTKGTTSFIDSYSRSDYGTRIVITPIIHLPDEIDAGEELVSSVTLQTEINFDTLKPDPNDRPVADRRHIKNEVRVLDGETVILGGLRKKTTRNEEEKIPFLGEIPGIGKLFGSTKLTSDSTEMFFFITPKIILDSRDEMVRIRTEDLRKRPGDIPEFLERLVEARKKEKKKFFENSLRMFFCDDC